MKIAGGKSRYSSPSKMASNHRSLIAKLLIWCAYALILIFFLTPIFWLVLTSVKPERLIFLRYPVIIFKPILSNYQDVFTNTYILKYFLNSLIITSLSCLLALSIGSLAAYSFSRFRIKGREDIAFWILSTRMLPPIASVIPIYLIGAHLELLDTYILMILIYAGFNVPYVVWMMRAFFADIPKEIEEAGLVDGCSRLGVLQRIVLPLSVAGLVSTAIFVFVLSINEFLYALVLTGMKTRTMPVAIAALITDRGIQWGRMTASGTILLIPLVIFYCFIQRHLVRGLTFGAIK